MAAVTPGRALDISAYCQGLEATARARYLDKIKLCDNFDPYGLKKKDFSYDLNDFPLIEFPDISNYLVVQTSFYTCKQMKAFKSLEAYNFFVCGWVHDLGVKRIKNNYRLVYARVNHSQRSTETPLKTWVISKEDGEVVTAHCNCMAGLSESCSHVGAVLYAVEAGVRMRQSQTCTMEKSKWLMPSHVKKIPAAPVSEIDFSSPKSKKQRLDDAICGTTAEPVKSKTLTCPPVEADSNTYKEFFDSLNRNFPKSAALMMNKHYYTAFIPKSATEMLPRPLLDYRSPATLEICEKNLKENCRTLKLQELTPAHISAVEKNTRKQSGSRIWYRQRAGRITASKLKQVLRTNPEKPSKSLIKNICYPEASRFSTAATRYGCKHEAQARKEYEKLMRLQHDNFTVSESGLHLNAKWPYMGASPDGIVMCSCCGSGACEIKCPHCQQDKENLAMCAGEKGFCLLKDGDHVKLDRNHAYYFQVQAQIHVMDIEFCDFIVWNKNDIFVERILPNHDFWCEIIPKAEKFFRECILPEVLGQCFTKAFTSCNSNVMTDRSP